VTGWNPSITKLLASAKAGLNGTIRGVSLRESAISCEAGSSLVETGKDLGSLVASYDIRVGSLDSQYALSSLNVLVDDPNNIEATAKDAERQLDNLRRQTHRSSLKLFVLVSMVAQAVEQACKATYMVPWTLSCSFRSAISYEIDEATYQS
jgi:hypothetical protein